MELVYIGNLECRSNIFYNNGDEDRDYSLYIYSTAPDFTSVIRLNSFSNSRAGIYVLMYQGMNITENTFSNNTGDCMMNLYLRSYYLRPNFITDNNLDNNIAMGHLIVVSLQYDMPLQFKDNNIRNNQAGANLIYWDTGNIQPSGQPIIFSGNFILANILSNRIASIMQANGYLGKFSPRNYFSNPEQVSTYVCVCVCVCVCLFAYLRVRVCVCVCVLP